MLSKAGSIGEDSLKIEKRIQIAATVSLSIVALPLGEWLFRASTPLGWAFLGLLTVDIAYLAVQEVKAKSLKGNSPSQHHRE